MADSSNPFVLPTMSSIPNSSNPFGLPTISDIPDSWEQDSDTQNVFAWLTPLNDFARHAFHQLVESMMQNPGTRKSERRFIHLDGIASMDASSASSSDDQTEHRATNGSRWAGAFKSAQQYTREIRRKDGLLVQDGEWWG